jgi:hypothetical protein
MVKLAWVIQVWRVFRKMVAWIKDDIRLEWFRIDVIWVRVCHTPVSKETLIGVITNYTNYSSVVWILCTRPTRIRWLDIGWWSRVIMVVIDRYYHKIHFCRRNHIDKKYRIKLMMEILKFSHLNLNIYKWFQKNGTVMLLNRIL